MPGRTRSPRAASAADWPGRAYALLHLFKYTHETVWFDRARALAERAAVADPTPDIPAYSLYKGTVGVAVLAADLENPSGSAMPFFEEEGWLA